jgi:hypothetical protein
VHLGGPRSGHAFAQVYGTFYGVVTSPPGSRVGWLGLFLKNVSDAPLFIELVEPNGRGSGPSSARSRCRPRPTLGGTYGIQGGIYVTDPPVEERLG